LAGFFYYLSIVISSSDLSYLIRHRRSIFPKQYRGRNISDLQIEELLENANYAPTHKLTEPWRFTVFKGEGLEQLAKFQAEHYKKSVESTGQYQEKKYDKLRSSPLKCSHVISIGLKRSDLVPLQEEIAAVACAVQNMLLTAAVLGIGCYWSTGGVTYASGVNEFFGLDSQDLLMGFLYIGQSDEVLFQGRRTPIEGKVRWVV